MKVKVGKEQPGEKNQYKDGAKGPIWPDASGTLPLRAVYIYSYHTVSL